MIFFVKKIITFVFVFILIYAPLCYLSDSYHSRDLSIYQLLKKKEKIKTGRSYQSVILGDSRALAVNFYPKKNMNNIYNYSFANSGGMYPYVYFLENYLKHQEKPRQILWSFIPLMLTDTWEIFKTPAPDSSAELYRSSKLISMLDMISFRKNSVFYLYPETTKKIIKNKMFINPSSIRKYFSEPYDIQNNKDLYNEITGGLIYSRNVQWEYTENNYLENIELNISDMAIGFIEDFLELARKNNIKVYLFNMPIPDKIYKKRMVGGFYTKYFKIIDKIRKKYPETLFVYGTILSYGSSNFIDGSHLNSSGANYFQDNDYPKIIKLLSGDHSQPSDPD